VKQSCFIFSRTPRKQARRPFIFNTIYYPALLLLLLASCTPRTLTPVFISDDISFNYKNDKDLKVWVSPTSDTLKPPEMVYVAAVEWMDERGIEPPLKKELGAFLRQYFYHGLLRQNYFDMKMPQTENLELYTENKPRLLILETAVTRIRKGSGLARYFIGYGLGRSDLQVEGRLREAFGEGDVMAFVMRYRHLGNTYMGKNPRSASSRYCLRLSMEAVALATTDLMKEVWAKHMEFDHPHPIEALPMER